VVPPQFIGHNPTSECCNGHTRPSLLKNFRKATHECRSLKACSPRTKRRIAEFQVISGLISVIVFYYNTTLTAECQAPHIVNIIK